MMKNVSNLLKLCSLLVLGVLVSGCATGYKRDTTSYHAAQPRYQTPSTPHQGTIYQAGQEMILFEDDRARRIGDILTIVLQESTQAKKKADTKTTKDNSIAMVNPSIPGISPALGVTADTQNEFQGKANSIQSNSLSGNISVTVADVLPNGNLYIRGEKWLTLNQGDEYIQVSGIVRPRDIRPDNTVFSTQIADARITYSGRGELADANAMGWLSRFFNSPIWPF